MQWILDKQCQEMIVDRITRHIEWIRDAGRYAIQLVMPAAVYFADDLLIIDDGPVHNLKRLTRVEAWIVRGLLPFEPDIKVCAPGHVLDGEVGDFFNRDFPPAPAVCRWMPDSQFLKFFDNR